MKNNQEPLVYDMGFITCVCILTFLFWIWIITGLIIDYNYILLLIVSPSILKFPMFYINKKVYSLLYRLIPPFHIIILIITLYIKLL